MAVLCSTVKEMVRWVGFDPTTLSLRDSCSDPLSYQRMKWCLYLDLNQKPSAYETGALP